MKVAIFLLVVACLCLGLLLFDTWLATDTQTHIIHFTPAAKPK